MSEAFERISQGLKEAIAHASDEGITGVVVHTLKPEKSATREQVAPIIQRVTSRFVAENNSVLTH
ncbi:MAG: hypothetical protein QX194_05605 [Methylococcales bacterium]